MRDRAFPRLLLAPPEVFAQRRGQTRLARGASIRLAAFAGFTADDHGRTQNTPADGRQYRSGPIARLRGHVPYGKERRAIPPLMRPARQPAPAAVAQW
jgi:hypothetical protein